jgi:uncharacterized phage protein (TIGR02218 family)
MKTLAAPLATLAAQTVTTWAWALRVTRQDTTVYGFTSHDVDATIDSVLYKARPGLAVMSLRLSSGLSVDSMDLSTLDDGTTFTKLDVLGGRWRNARFLLFKYNWASPADGIDPMTAGTFGEVTLQRNTVRAELRGLQQFLQHAVGAATSKTCRYRLGVNNGFDSRCPVVLASFTVTGTVTGVTNNQVFTDSALAQATGWFDEGLLTWDDGPNVGFTSRVKLFAAGGLITLGLPMLATVANGHNFTLSAGCRKRLIEDCKTKFNALLDFGGEPHAPTVDDLTTPVEPGS